MALQKELRRLADGQMNLDDAPEFVSAPDYLEAYNLVERSDIDQNNGYGTNLPSAVKISGPAPVGINKGVGLQSFETLRKLYGFRYNSQQYHQIIEIDADTNQETVIFENLTNSSGIDILQLKPKPRIDDIRAVNNEFLVWLDSNSEINCISLERLKSGSLTKEDLMLIKAQPMAPITAVYNDDPGRGANLLNNKLFQFLSAYITKEYTYSAYSTWSKRPVPVNESSASVGTDVSKNNNIVLSVDIGNDRVNTVLIGGRYGSLDFFEIKRVDRSYILALTNTSVNVSAGVYEAYDPTTNRYSFAFYNDGLYQPIEANLIDLAYDYVPPQARALEVVNDDIIAVGDITEGYPKPETQIQVSSSSYNPNFTTPPAAVDPLRVVYTQNSNFAPGKYKVTVKFDGLPKTGDVLSIVLHDIQYYPAKQNYSYTVPSGLQDNLEGVLRAWVAQIPNSNYYQDDNSGKGLQITTSNYYELESATVELANADPINTVNESRHALKSNSSYQLALSYRDKYGRYFPLLTGNEYVVKTLGYAQTQGLTPQINWSILTPNAPVGAVDYQWMLSYNTTHLNSVYTLASLINYRGIWNANTNMPTLNAGDAGSKSGDAYQVTVSGTNNIGNGSVTFNVGDYAVYNGRSWDRLPKSFGDLTNSADYIVLSLQPLARFNRRNSSSVITYDYTPNDRVTLLYYQPDQNRKTWFNNPAVDVEVVGFEPTLSLLKIRKSPAIDTAMVAGKNMLIEVYTPKRVSVTDNATQDNTTVFYEIGERFTITNGQHDVLNGTITDGDFYFKTRRMVGSVDPNIQYQILAESPHFSDFYESNFYSYGRPRTEFDTPETTNKKASIRYSDKYVIGSKVNGLSRFYAERIYGEGDGETSSSYGAIRKLYQRGNILMCIQETELGYIPVFNAVIEDQSSQGQLAVSNKLFNKIRYSGSRIGMGVGKSTFAFRGNNVFFFDTNRCEPIKATLGGIEVISNKVSKFFKRRIKDAVKNGYGLGGFVDNFSEHYIVTIDTKGDVVEEFEFKELTWDPLESYTVLPGSITISTLPAHGTVTYDSATGKAIYTPTNGFVGNDSFMISFLIGDVLTTKKVCITVGQGITSIQQFLFQDINNADQNTLYISNSVSVSGNNVPVPISIVSGEYSVNGGPWQTASSYVYPNDTVRVRVTSAAAFDTSVSTTLTISDKSDTYTVRTAPDGVGNEERSGSFNRDTATCPDGQTGQPYLYVVPANTYFAPTLAEANDMADADIAANGQNAANTYGTCTVNYYNQADVRLSDSPSNVCTQPATPVYYSNYEPAIGPGVTVYYDPGFTMLVTEQYLADVASGVIYNVNTGVIESSTGNFC